MMKSPKGRVWKFKYTHDIISQFMKYSRNERHNNTSPKNIATLPNLTKSKERSPLIMKRVKILNNRDKKWEKVSR